MALTSNVALAALLLSSSVNAFTVSPHRSTNVALNQHIGSGGMADTRNPDAFEDEDPRKSISAAPSFEEYLKQRADVLQNLQEKQDADSVEGDEAEASDETTGQAKNPVLPVYDRMPQDAADGGGKSATKRKTPKKTADEGDDEGSQNALTEQGGLVVNGLDIFKYIRGIERRVSELERKLAAATSTEMPSTENDNVV